MGLRPPTPYVEFLEPLPEQQLVPEKKTQSLGDSVACAVAIVVAVGAFVVVSYIKHAH